MKTDKELVEFCKGKLGTPYVYGTKGTVLTEARLEQLKRECPNVHTVAYQQKARQYLNKVCTDCSGLISWCTGVVRGSCEYHDTAVDKKPVSSLDDTMIGWALWKRGHIGVYIGGGECIEAKGITYGTVKTKVSDNKTWQLALKLKDIQYTENTQVLVVKKEKEDIGLDAKWRQDPDTKKWYCFNRVGGAMRDQWLQYKGKWYYFNADGSMVTGMKTIEWKFYYFDGSGAMIAEGIQALQEMLKSM